MAFEGKLSSVITNGDELAAYWKSLLQHIHDLGGDARTLNRLLDDAKGSRLLLNELIKKTMGEIWTLVSHPVDLKINPAYFKYSPSELVQLHPQNSYYEGYSVGEFTETVPSSHCLYRLHHFSLPLHPSKVEKALSSIPNIEPAGWRESLAYTRRISSECVYGHGIVSAGSRSKEFGFFSTAVADLVQFDYTRRWFEKGEKFRPSEFFLVRVYSHL